MTAVVLEDAIDFDAVTAFVATVEHGSVNRAAERLGLAQPVVTRRIQRLEALLGVELFDRRVRPVALTPAGVRSVAPCRAALQAMADLRAVARHEEPAGELRLGVAPALADLALPNTLAALRVRYPRVALRVHTEWTPQLIHQLHVGVLDLAVAQLPLGATPPADLDAQALGVEELCVVAAAHLGLEPELELADLAQFAWVLNPEGCGARVLLEAMLRSYEMRLVVAAELDGYELHAALVAQGLGLGLLPARILRQPALLAQLQPIQVRNHRLALQVWSVSTRTRPQVQAPLDLLTEELAQIIAQGLDGPPYIKEY